MRGCKGVLDGICRCAMFTRDVDITIRDVDFTMTSTELTCRTAHSYYCVHNSNSDSYLHYSWLCVTCDVKHAAHSEAAGIRPASVMHALPKHIYSAKLKGMGGVCFLVCTSLHAFVRRTWERERERKREREREREIFMPHINNASVESVVCIYVCIYVWMHVYTCMYVCIFIHLYIFTYLCIYDMSPVQSKRADIYLHKCIHIHTYWCTRARCRSEAVVKITTSSSNTEIHVFDIDDLAMLKD